MGFISWFRVLLHSRTLSASVIGGICECFEVTYQLHRGTWRLRWIGLEWSRALDLELNFLRFLREGKVGTVARCTCFGCPKGPVQVCRN